MHPALLKRKAGAILAALALSATLITPVVLSVTASVAQAATPLSVAQAQIGTLEGSARANSYGAAVGRSDSTANYSWCATFLSWVMRQTGANPLRSASVGDWVDEARHNRSGLSVTTSPRAGDLVAFDWDGNGDYEYPNRHIGMVESVQTTTSFTTVEGNTSQPGGGPDGVWRKQRSGSSPNQVLFIRLSAGATTSVPVQSRPEAPAGWYTQEISSPVASGVGVTSQQAGYLDAFFIDTNGALVQRFYRNTGVWSVGANFGAPRNGATGRPAAASQQLGRLDVFQRTTTGELAQRYYSNGAWSAWAYPPVGTLATSPAAASWGAGRLDLFSVNTSGQLTHAWYSAGTWAGFRVDGMPNPSGVTLTGAPSAESWGSGRLDVVAHDTTGRVWQTYYSNGTWGPWRDLTANTSLRAGSGDSVAVSSWGAGRLDVFVKATDGYTWHQWYDNSTWSGYQNLATTSPNGPAAVSWGSGRVDVFYRSTSSKLGHDWFQR